MAKRGTRGDALRNAVDQTFQAAADQAQTTRERAQELVDELAQTAGRLRGALDEFRPLAGEDARDVRDRLADLERRVSVLEKAQSGAGRRAPAKRRSASSPRAGRAKSTRSGSSRAGAKRGS